MTGGSDAHSIFVSYARIDNLPDTDDRNERGWVDHFQARLQKRLAQLGRSDVSFWRDVAEIEGAQRFAPRIIKGLAESRFFLPVMSPTYVQRTWCQEEVKRFAGQRAQDASIDERIVPVYKLPVDEPLIPELIRGRGGYRFYELDSVTKRLLEYYRRDQVHDEAAYGDLIDQIANYVCANLPEIAPYAQVSNPEAGTDVITVFVAKAADDMYPAYAKVVTELKAQGFRVVIKPEDELPTDLQAAEAEVAGALDRAKLTVHLLGDDAGPRLGRVRLVDALLDQTRAAPIPRVIWAPATLFDDPTRPESTAREQNRNALDVLGGFGNYRDDDNVLDVPFEAFLQDLVRRCQDLRAPVAASPQPGDGGAATVYVVGADDDAALVYDVTGALIDGHGLAARPCAFQGAPDELRRHHHEEMRDSDAVLYCWGNASDISLMSYTQETRHPERLGRDRPFRATALFRGPPLTNEKQRFRSADISLPLPPAEAVKPEVFAPLAEALK